MKAADGTVVPYYPYPIVVKDDRYPRLFSSRTIIISIAWHIHLAGDDASKDRKIWCENDITLEKKPKPTVA